MIIAEEQRYCGELLVCITAYADGTYKCSVYDYNARRHIWTDNDLRLSPVFTKKHRIDSRESITKAAGEFLLFGFLGIAGERISDKLFELGSWRNGEPIIRHLINVRKF